MKRKRRRRPIFFRYYDCDVFADYLAKQAKKGWHFAEFRMGMIFEKGEPADREYAVEVFPKGSEWETGPTVETEEYAQYCEAAGWKFVDSTRKFCVFEKIREDAETIVTDEERLENIWKAQRVNHILDVLLEASYIGSWMWASGLSSALYFDQMSLLWFLLCLGILAVSAGDFAVHLIWYLRQRKRLYQGKEIT